MMSRLTSSRGEALPHSKLTDDIVRRIRRIHAKKQRLIAALNARYSALAIAESIGVHARTVEKVLQRESWIHVRD